MNEIIPGYDCLAELRKIREDLSRQHNGDMDAIFESLKTAKERYLASLQPSDREKIAIWESK